MAFNNDNGLAYVGIFGSNINNPANMSANTFHVNCLNAIDTPLAFVGAPSGSVMWKTCATLNATDRILVIQP